MRPGSRTAPRVHKGGLLLLAGLLGACAGHAPLPAQRVATAAAPTATREQRLQALESRVDRLAHRLDQLQGASGNPVTRQSGPPVPVALQPIRPQLVLAPRAAQPVRATPARPAPPPRPAPLQPREPARSPPRHGGWVINLASYTSRHYAADKLATFVAAGVPAEQVEAQVNGTTVYRLRVAGFPSYRAASARAEAIQARLGLQETWIARR